MKHLQEDVKRNKFQVKYNPILERSPTENNSRLLELPIESKGTPSGVSGHAEVQVPHDSHLLEYSIKLSLHSIQKDFEDQIKMMPSCVDENKNSCVFEAALRVGNRFGTTLALLTLAIFCASFPL